MNSRWIAMIVVALGLAATMFSLSGCNTWHGAGKDVERAGEKMQGEP